MKSWTITELDNVINALTPLKGLRLQEVQTSNQDVVLGFYSPADPDGPTGPTGPAGLYWLWIDMDAARPSLLPWQQLPLHVAQSKIPLQLFLRAHFLNHALTGVQRVAGVGRVIELQFGSERRLEIRLFPHTRNILAKASDKKIAWQKPVPLQPFSEHKPNSPNSLSSPVSSNSPSSLELRNLSELRAQWLESRSQGRRPVREKRCENVFSKLQTQIAKKQKALAKVAEELTRQKQSPFKEIGNWLKVNQSLDVPKEYEHLVDKRRKLSWNIEECFTRAREVGAKTLGTQKRFHLLQSEIAELQAKLDNPNGAPNSKLLSDPPTAKVNRPKQPSLNSIGAQGRTLRLEDGLIAVAGKSAVDNMKILRKARAWDLWFHLKDYPSSHAVLFRSKNHKSNDYLLREIALWFVRMHLGSKASQNIGEKFAVAITECRYVKPIKGDKIGRVTYHDEVQCDAEWLRIIPRF